MEKLNVEKRREVVTHAQTTSRTPPYHALGQHQHARKMSLDSTGKPASSTLKQQVAAPYQATHRQLWKNASRPGQLSKTVTAGAASPLQCPVGTAAVPARSNKRQPNRQRSSAGNHAAPVHTHTHRLPESIPHPSLTVPQRFTCRLRRQRLHTSRCRPIPTERHAQMGRHIAQRPRTYQRYYQ